jgi:prolyl 4-hydroxylase
MSSLACLFVWLLHSSPTCCLATSVPSEDESYGVDMSFPMHYHNVSTNYAWLPHNIDPSLPTPPEYKGMPIQRLGDKQSAYDRYIQGCIEAFREEDPSGEGCLTYEVDRIDMNLRQPMSVKNYTTLGYKKIKAPEELFSLIKTFWERNNKRGEPEDWDTSNTYVNYWESLSYMVHVDDTRLRGGGYSLKEKIWDAARDAISEWTGQELKEVSLYGVRTYTTGAMLATHVDRMPLVASAIINVAQDLDEPWPLEVVGHDGKAANITMEPGDMVL